MRALKYIFSISALLLPLSLLALGEGSKINMGISPIRIEASVATGQTISRQVTFYNNSTTTYNIFLSAEDCFADVDYGTPKCRPYVGTGTDGASLASWIHFSGSDHFSVPPKGEKKITFTISPPLNALPGGHYGAVFFNNPDNGNASENSVKMNRRVGALLLVNISGKLVYNTSLGDVSIDIPSFNSAPTGIEDIISMPKTRKNWNAITEAIMTDLNPFWNQPSLVDTEDFNVNFHVPVTNSGNTHILPTGSIELIDEDGTILKKVGKEGIRSPEGVFLGDRIVDYLPINDEGGNVLPGTDRVYTTNWQGFAYETLKDGKMTVEFMTPGQYYSNITAENAKYLYPWEKLKIRVATKNIRAKIHVEYIGENGKVIPMDLEKIITVKYNYIDKTLNYGVILLVTLIILIAWFIIHRRDEKIEELEEEVDELEEDIDELEHAKRSAKAILAKKQKKEEVESSPKEEATPPKKPRAPRKKKEETPEA